MDEWNTESGLATDYDGTVVESWFGTDSRNTFNPEGLFLFWRVKLDDPLSYPGLHDGETTERFSCGADWETNDGGETAEHPTPDKKFHANSNYGKIINRAIKQWKIKDLLASRGSPTTAKVWVGLRFHFGGEEWKFEDRSGERVMPQTYLGDSGGTAPTKSSKKVDISGIPESHVEQLRAAAAKSTNHGQFVSNVLGLPEEVRTPIVMDALTDDGLYMTLKG